MANMKSYKYENIVLSAGKSANPGTPSGFLRLAISVNTPMRKVLAYQSFCCCREIVNLEIQTPR